MHLKIENDLVRKNIEIFKIILKRAIQAHEKEQNEKVTQQFKAFIHRGCGEIRFSDLSPESLDSKDWTLVSFHFSIPSSSDASFQIDITDIDEEKFSWEGFDTKAVSALKETLKTIQFISRFLPRLKSLTAVLKEFSLMNLDTFLDELSTKDLVHEAWHSLTRQECEELLHNKPPGVFLFRKDEYADTLEACLSTELDEPIKCITLTYVASFGKISDLTLVKRECGWIIYNNDPTLEGPLYPSARSLLESLKGLFKTPLFHPR
jgi:hypothetical protein